MNYKKYCAIREKILESRQSREDRESYEIGKRREEQIRFSLQELKKRGIIRDFLQTENLSFQDIVEGIDFFVIYSDGAKYRTCPLSVTGERWAEKDRDRHPDVPVIAIDFSDPPTFIENKIMEAISQNK